MATSIFQLSPEHGVGSWTVIKGISINFIQMKALEYWTTCPPEYLNITTDEQGKRIENISPYFLQLKVDFT